MKAYKVLILVCFRFFMQKESEFSSADTNNIVLFLANFVDILRITRDNRLW